MSYAPATLLQARAYIKAQTGLGDDALGIVGDAAHTYGYHLGRDRLKTGDYSRVTARDLAGLSSAASALDIGNFDRLRDLTAFMVREARAGRLPDVRELIGPGADGRAYRWDHLAGWSAVRRAVGDSHEWHLHISYYRDSEPRSKLRPFEQFFEGDDVSAQEVWDHPLESATGRRHTAAERLLDVQADVDKLKALPPAVAALTGQVSGLIVLVQQLATAPAVDLTPEQLADLTAAVTQAAAAAAESALERVRIDVVNEGGA